MTKTNLLDDTFEKLAELGTSTAKKAVQSVVRTFNPLDQLLSSERVVTESSSKQIEKLRQNKNNHTPLDFEKLNQKYMEKDKAMQEALRQRLFQLVRQGEEKLLQENRQKEIENKRKEEWEKEKRKKREEEEKRQQQTPIPMGKIRRSIFSPKKVAQRQHIETKASSGKQ